MAYDKKKLYQQALDVVSKSTMIIFIEDIVAMLPCDKTTFYKHFPIDSNENNELKERIEKNRITIKNNIRGKWYKDNNFSAQIALYKLCSTKQELEALSMVKNNDTDDKETTASISIEANKTILPSNEADVK